jgi:hypothetical protein
MARVSLRSVRATYDRRRVSAIDMYQTLRPYAEEGAWDGIWGWEPIHPSQALGVVGLSFLQLVIAWEDLVEACFVRYIAGATSPSGFKPTLRLAPASTLAHAYELASGQPGFRSHTQFLSWTRWRDVVERASVFLHGGKPFSDISQPQRDKLADAVKIRNRVAHTSLKARSEFADAAKRHLGVASDGKLRQGFTVGHLLLDVSGRGFGGAGKGLTYFDHYAELFSDAAEVICPA